MGKKKVLWIVVTVILVMGILGGMFIMDYNKKLAQREAEEAAIADAYLRFNYSMLWIRGYPIYDPAMSAVFIHWPEIPEDMNVYGIDVDRYLILKYYERMTGNVVLYETVVEYASQEFEEDGTLRLYNNGRHLEIEGYVDWAWGREKELDQYTREIERIYNNYGFDHKAEGFNWRVIYELSPQMLDELVKKEADPDYEMDLMALQAQGL